MNMAMSSATHLSYYLGEAPKSQPYLFSKATGSTLRVVTTIASTAMFEFRAVVSKEDLSPEDKVAREKGLQLVARIEHLYQTNEGFQRWIQAGIDDIEAGRTTVFSEDGWKE
jgi:hypothetical protein